MWKKTATFVPMKDCITPHPLVAAIPLIVLIAVLAMSVYLFGSDTLSGASQIALIFASSVVIGIAMLFYHIPWKVFDKEMRKIFGGMSVTLFILLSVGMLSGSWMISGVVPTLIYYGVQIMSPTYFLLTTCVICSLVSVLSGSSWTTVATIGVALLGIGQALNISPAWTAGAIISGAYFGDKLSPLSDTTILASSYSGTDLFVHIRYLLLTTVPSILITLVLFLAMGFWANNEEGAIDVSVYTDGLSAKFNISLWTLCVPILTGVMIARKMPSLFVLFLSSVLAGITALVLQQEVLYEIAHTFGDYSNGAHGLIKGLSITYFGSTAVDTGNESLNQLVSTGGMVGMLNTIWLILCSVFFGSAMVAAGMVRSITNALMSFIRNRTSLVTSTVFSGLFLNFTTGDQFISIILASDMFKDAYRKMGFESRLLSRSIEDGTTVTSVLVPWNTCGMTQATVLDIPTLTYLPYCFFNILSPLVSIFVAALGWKIIRRSSESATS